MMQADEQITVMLLATELAALERQKKSPQSYNCENCLQVFSAVFDPILFIIAGNKNIYKCLNEFRPDPTTNYGVSCPWASNKSMSPLFLVAIDQIHFKFVGNEDMHNISNKFEFRPDWITTELSALENLKNTPIDL